MSNRTDVGLQITTLR